MTALDKSFLKWLIASILTVTLFIAAMGFIPVFVSYQSFAWVTTFLFVLLTIFGFFAGKMTVKSINKNLFTGFLMGFILMKLLLCTTFVITYHHLVKPSDTFFLIPFFGIYLIFSILEYVFLTKIGKY